MATAQRQEWTAEEYTNQAALLRSEAEELWAKVKKLRGEAAAMDSRAERVREAEQSAALEQMKRQKRANRAQFDPLYTAAACAVSDQELPFTPEQFGDLLEIRDLTRTTDLLAALEVAGHVVPAPDGKWRHQDPEMSRVRDAMVDRALTTEDELADELELPLVTLRHYLKQLATNQVIVYDEGLIEYIPPTGEFVSRIREATPESLIGGQEAQQRGNVVAFTSHKQREPDRRQGIVAHQKAQKRRNAGRSRHTTK